MVPSPTTSTDRSSGVPTSGVTALLNFQVMAMSPSEFLHCGHEVWLQAVDSGLQLTDFTLQLFHDIGDAPAPIIRRRLLTVDLVRLQGIERILGQGRGVVGEEHGLGIYQVGEDGDRAHRSRLQPALVTPSWLCHEGHTELASDPDHDDVAARVLAAQGRVDGLEGHDLAILERPPEVAHVPARHGVDSTDTAE